MVFISTKLVLNTVIKIHKNEFSLNFYTDVRNTNFTKLDSDLAFVACPKPVINTALVKSNDTNVCKNGVIAYINFNFTLVDALPNYSATDTLLSNLPVPSVSCYIFIKAYDGQYAQRCGLSNGDLKLLYEKKLEAGKTYNAVIMYPLK